MRALVKETMSREQVDPLAGDIEEACKTLDEKGGATSTSASRSRRAPATEGSSRPGAWPDRQAPDSCLRPSALPPLRRRRR